LRRAPAIFAVLLLLLATGAARAADIAWINPAGGDFNEPANWSTMTVPGEGDNAIITLDGTYTVVVDERNTVSGLILGAASGNQTLAVSSDLTANTATINPNGVLAQSGGTFTAATATLLGVYNWSAGSIGGVLNVAPSGQLNISPGGGKGLAGTINNSGTATWNNLSADDRVGGSGGSFNNLAGGVFNSTANSGRVNLFDNAPFNNAGTLNSLSGTLDILGTSGIVSGTSTGTFNAGAGAGISFSYGGGSEITYVLNAGTQFTGAGVTTFNGGNIDVRGTATIVGTAELAGASIVGTVPLTVAPAGRLDWKSGTIAGTLAVSPGAVMNILPGGKALSGNVNNAGVANWSSGSGDRISGNATAETPGGFNNLAGGVFNNMAEAGRVNLFDNAPFNNAGTLNGLSGTIDFLGTSGAITGTSSGIFNAAAAGTGPRISFSYGGGSEITYVLNAGTQFTGPGVTSFTGGNIEVRGASTISGVVELADAEITGQAALTATSGGQMNWKSGTIAGTVAISPGAVMNISPGGKALPGRVNNAGVANWNSGGSGDRISGNATGETPGGFNNLAGGVFNNRAESSRVNRFDNAPFNNAGTLNGLTGTLDIHGTSGAITGTSTGTFNAAVAATGPRISFSYGGGSEITYILKAGTKFTGPGVTSLVSGQVEVQGASTVSGVLELAGAEITGQAALTVASGGRMNWKSGTIDGIVATARGGLLNILAGGKALNGKVNNAGVANWNIVNLDDRIAGNGSSEEPGSFNNLAGGIFNSSSSFGRTNRFDNAPFNNAGTLNGLSGTLDIHGLSGAITGTSTGIFNAAGGGTGPRITFSYGGGSISTYIFKAGTRFTGPGISRITGGQVLVEGATTVAGRLEMAGGDLNGPGAITVAAAGTFSLNGGEFGLGGALNVSLGGTLNYSGGSLNSAEESAAAGTVNIARGGFFNLLGTASKPLGRRVTNAGTTTFVGTGGLDGFDGQDIVFTNALGGVLNTARGTTTIADINVINSGTLNPGGTGVGTLAIVSNRGEDGGDFTQTSTGTLNIQIGGTAPASLDRVTASGRAILSGALSPTLLGSFAPPTNSRFAFLTAPRRTGAFSRVLNSPLVGGRVVFVAYPEGRAEVVISIRATILSVTPLRGSVGTVVTITGANLADVNRVRLGDLLVGFTRVSASVISFKIPNSAVSGRITVINPAGETISTAVVTVVPTITSFSPTSGPVATSVLISGANLTGATAVRFGTTSATFTRISATQIRATVPAGATSGRVSIVTPGGTAVSPGVFTVTTPSIPRS
jgi:hypothetical protein